MKKVVRIFLYIIAVIALYGQAYCTSTEQAIEIPVALSTYEQLEIGKDLSLCDTLINRIKVSPFNIVTLIIFLSAIVHTFVTPRIQRLANKIHQNNTNNSAKISFLSQILRFCGEVEVVFGLWCIPLIICIIYTFGWDGMSYYFHNVVNYSEPIFVFVIMIMANTKPILSLAENILGYLARIGHNTPAAWWLTILIITPMMGSLITEPAAMTIGAILLAKQFYSYQPSNTLKYASLGLLFVNISVGGTLTHFAAPPVLMVANKWSLTLSKVFIQFGCHAIIGIIISTIFYYIIFYKELHSLKNENRPLPQETHVKIPCIVTIIHILFLCWTVLNIHTPALVIAGLIFFIGFSKATNRYQNPLNIRNPLLVGFFLAGLVTHGGFQSWWLAPVLSSLNESTLFLGATILTTFNDNAAITYLSSLVPTFSTNHSLQHAVLSGAVTGGGLTVIANAPNSAGQNILSPYFSTGVSPLKLFLSAIIPTIIVALCFIL